MRECLTSGNATTPALSAAGPAIAVVLAAALVIGQAAPQPTPGPREVGVSIETTLGTIEAAIDVARAPITAANFLKYVDAGLFDGGIVNRAVRADNTVRHDVRIEVIQFQTNPARRSEEFAPIPLERTNLTGLAHLDGTLSMARGAPDTATGSFSIVIGEQPEMNYGGKRNPDGQGFAAFGRVVRGMDVVRAIQRSPTGQKGAYGTETLEPPITVVKVIRH